MGRDIGRLFLKTISHNGIRAVGKGGWKNEKLESFNWESPTCNWKNELETFGLMLECSGWSWKARNEVRKCLMKLEDFD